MKQTPIILLDKFWPYQVVLLADLVSRHTISVLKEHGDMNLSQWRVLAAVAETPGRTSAEVVAVTPMDKGIVSRAVASLITDGILNKVGDSEDKRRSRLYLTKTGEGLYSGISRAIIARTDTVERPAGFSDDLDAIIKSIRAIQHASTDNNQ